MAVQAAAPLLDVGVGLGAVAADARNAHRPADSRCNTGNAGSAVPAMALVANQRWTRLEQVVGSGSVRHMAIRAVVIDRLMVMHERPAFFHVAGVASLDDTVALHQLRPGRAVRVMAIGAAHFAFQYWMVRLFVDLRALLLVAGETHFGLGALVPDLVMGRVYLVA